ncbi:MAG: hypothetical protein F2840_14005 [Actinobacteria bacterium]|jgi:hypothetical protein|uniref:Unannotated protein n=1 Tax=freshwater metagenome TaxID=449393 RepID=A0A6J7LL74_9ZZZZ|nr:hypothetical protein [Actinomycetota bacterium]
MHHLARFTAVAPGGATLRGTVQVTLSKVCQQNGEAILTEAMTTRGLDFESNVWSLER